MLYLSTQMVHRWFCHGAYSTGINLVQVDVKFAITKDNKCVRIVYAVTYSYTKLYQL